MLRQFGFQEQAVDLMFRTVLNNWYSVLINGSPGEYFRASRGVRQGDPFSPAMFLLVSEFLGRGLQHLFEQNESRYYVSPGSRVPYLAFADYMLVLARCSEDCLDSLVAFFARYQAYFGQRINGGKSSFILSNRASEDTVALVREKLQFQQQMLPFVYLGAPISRGRVTCILFDPILAKMQSRLSHWSSRLLSKGGKLALFRHVLSSIPMYLLQVLQPPRAVFQRLGRICNAFLWDKANGSKGIHWTSWEKVCFPTSEGGLGVRSFGDISVAFACKL